MNRRQLLKRGLIGGVLLAGAGLFVYPTRERDDVSQLESLTPRAYAVLAAIAERVVPHANGAQIARRIDASLAFVAPDAVTELNQLLSLFDNALASAVFDLRFAPFTRQDAETQDAILVQWRDSRVTVRRSGYQALRRLCLGGCYQDETEQRDIGYPGPRKIPGVSFDDSTMGTKAWLAAQGPK